MLNSVLLATTMLIAGPVFAQDVPKPAESQPVQQAPAATPATPVTDDATDKAADATASTPQTAPAAQPAEVAATPAAPPAKAAAAEPAPASSQEQVAQAVGRDFGTYDKDADGALNAAEFGEWMVALRKAAEPSFVPGSAEAKAWQSQAFTAADADKSASINKQELTTFLTPKPS
ncbi:MAG: hypothetical protein EOP61_02425 [Sphingomonadales bacterium]|nr:MAG: hypothetical protein EOP61_02425 [Sphingomonadales bacterium]